MYFTALQIAAHLNGRIEGDPGAKVNAVGKIEDASEGQLSFVANPKYAEYLYTTQATILIVNEDLAIHGPVQPTLVRVKDAYSGFASLLQLYNEVMSSQRKTGIEQPAHVAASARLGKDVYIGAFSYIGEGVNIGPGGLRGGQDTAQVHFELQTAAGDQRDGGPDAAVGKTDRRHA